MFKLTKYIQDDEKFLQNIEYIVVDQFTKIRMGYQDMIHQSPFYI